MNLSFRKKIIILSLLLVILIILVIQNGNLLRRVPLVGDIYGLVCKANLPLGNNLIGSNVSYTIPDSELKLFNQKLSGIADKSVSAGYKRLLGIVKDYSPEAYFIVVKHGWRQPETLESTLSAWWFGETIETATIITHEYLHSARYPCFYLGEYCSLSKSSIDKLNGDYQSYGLAFDDRRIGTQTSLWVDDKSYGFELNKSKVFQSRDVNADLVSGTSFDSRIDQIYLSNSDGDIETLMSEMNSYIKSIQVARAMGCSSLPPGKADSLFYASALSRIMYLTSLYLDDAKNSAPRAWEYLTENKEFAYMLRWLITTGMNEVQYTVDEYRNGKTTYINDTDQPDEVEDNVRLIETGGIFEEFYQVSGVNEIPLNFADEGEMQSFGLNYQIFKY